jgi:hypothetical protein
MNLRAYSFSESLCSLEVWSLRPALPEMSSVSYARMDWMLVYELTRFGNNCTGGNNSQSNFRFQTGVQFRFKSLGTRLHGPTRRVQCGGFNRRFHSLDELERTAALGRRAGQSVRGGWIAGRGECRNRPWAQLNRLNSFGPESA